jgi:ribonuclease HI
VFDPHAVKINIDGNCWDNPGGPGGLGVRVDYGCDINREPEVVEYRGYFETNNQRMELRACIFAHQWVEGSAEDLGFPRFIVLSDPEYMCNG